MILDTSFLIDLLRGKDQKVKQKAEELDRVFTTREVSAITVMELWRGACKAAKTKKEKEKVDTLLQSLVIHNFNQTTAKYAAEIEVDLEKRGEMIDLEDIMIAATARATNKKILTRNNKHFKRIQNITIETY